MFRRFATCTALTAALLAPVAGCGGDSSPAAKPSPTPQPAEVLAAAATRTAGINLKLEMIDGGDAKATKVNGSYDTTKRLTLLAGTEDGETMQLVVGPEKAYLSGLNALEGKTFRIDLAKLPSGNGMVVFAEPMFPLLLLPTATTVTLTAPGSFSGTLDLTRVQAASIGARKFVEGASTAAAAKANALPFTATVNAQGYLATISVTFPAWGDEHKDARIDTSYSGYGDPVTVAEPTGAAVLDAPDGMYTAD